MTPVPTLGGLPTPEDREPASSQQRRDTIAIELGARTVLAIAILAFHHGYEAVAGERIAPVVQWAALLAIVLNVPYYLAARTGCCRRGQAYARLTIDLLLVTAGLYGFGALQAGAYIGLYAPIVLAAGFTVASGASVVAAAVATAAYVVAALLPPTVPVPESAHAARLWATAVFNLMVVDVAGVVTMMLAAAYRRSRHEALTARQELEQAHGRIVEAERLRAIGELSAGASHHLNNLLAVALGRIQIAMRRLDNTEEAMRNLEIAEHGLLDAGEVVRRMSMFSRAQAMSEWVSVDLNRVAREVVELTRPRWQSEAQMRGITVDTRLDCSPVPPVAGDPATLREMLMNLVLNAVDALPGGGTVVIRTWTAEGRVFCSVADNGVGMSPEVRKRALEPFFTTKGLRSTGLGLSLSYGIIRRHHGSLDIESAEGRGTTVTVGLPASGPLPEPARDCAPAAPAARRILLIDDDAGVREVVAEMLGMDGHAVVTAASGAEGLALLEGDATIDLVLTDLGMPGMTGWDVARAAKAHRASLPVGLITGWGNEQRAPVEAQGMVDFVVQKPVTRAELAEAIVSAPAPRATSR
jgi:signal transduction histidine kinase/ActR/RegA family two-component response regulator